MESQTIERDYTTTSIPNDLAVKIDAVLKKGGFQNRGDFVREAVRKHLEYFKEA